MVQFTLVVLSLAGYGAAACAYLRMPMYQSFVFAFCCIIEILYLGGLLGIVDPLTWVVAIVGVLVLIGTVGQKAWLRAKAARDLVPETTFSATGAPLARPALLRAATSVQAYVVLAVALVVLTSFAIRWAPSYMVLNWDEFSGWAYTPKLMFFEDKIFDANSPVLFKTYPPAGQLSQYYFTNIIGYHEWIGVFAQAVLIWGCFAAAAGKAFRHPITGALAFAIGYVALWAFDYSFVDVLSDGVLGLLLAAAIVPVFASPRNWTTTLYFTVVLSTMALWKPTGTPLAMVGLGCFGAALAFDIWQSWTSEKAFPGRVALRALWKLLAVGGWLLFVLVIWQFYIKAINATAPFAPMGSPSELMEFFTHPEADRSLKIWANLPLKLWDLAFFRLEYPLPGVGNFTLWLSTAHIWLILLGLSALSIAATPKGSRLLVAGVLTFVALGAIPYLGVILTSYRFLHSEAEGIAFAAFDRYMGTYFLMWLVVVGGVMANAAVHRSFVWRPLFWIPAALFLCGAPTTAVRTLVLPEEKRPVPLVYSWMRTYPQEMALRAQLKSLADIVRREAQPDDRIYYVSQNETGYTFYAFRFEMIPFTTNLSGFSLGPRYREGDIWSVDSPLEDVLAGYQFLVIRKADTQFKMLYGKYLPPEFADAESGVFRIEFRPEGLHLTPLPP